MNLTDFDTPFLIKLDHLDLNYVSNFNFQYDDVSRPLWSTKATKNHGIDDFVQFQIMAEKRIDSACRQDKSDDDDTTGYPLYKCVMCERDVPIAYKREHNNSILHKTCLKIAEAVLKRLQSHLLIEDKNEIVKNSSYTYFCEACTVIVKKSDKINHEASTAHQKSVLHDSCLNDFLSLYLDKDYLDTFHMKYFKLPQQNRNVCFDEKIKNTSKIEQKNKDINSIFVDDEQHTSKTKEPSISKDKVSGIPSMNEEMLNKPLILSDNEDSENSWHEVKNKKKKKQNNTIIDDKKFKQTCFEKKVLVKKNLKEQKDEESFSTDDSNVSECSCSDYTDYTDSSNEEDQNDPNMTTVDHLTDNENTINEQYHSIDDSKDVTDEASSNKENSDIEENNNLNKETSKPNSIVDYIMLVNSNEFNVEVKTETKKDNNNILRQPVLEKYLNILNKLSHTDEACHKLKYVSEDYIEIQTVDDCLVTVKADNFNGLVARDGGIECRTCMKAIENNPSKHIFDTEHLTNVSGVLDVHCIREVSTIYYHCVHCNVTFANIEMHKSLESHITALMEAVGRSVPPKPVEAKKVGRTYCEPCNIYIDSHNFNSHTNGKTHKNNLSLFFTRNTKLESIVGSRTDKTYCEKCNTHILTSNYTAHINQHASTDLGKIHCEPCNLQIRKDMFRAHLYGKNHQTSLLLTNETRKVTGKLCQICNLYTDHMPTHLTGGYHEYHANKNNAKKNAPIVPNVPIPAPSTSNSKPETHINYQIKFNKLSEAVCAVCNVKVPKNADNISEHTKGRTHKANYNDLLTYNKIKMVNNKFKCDICKVTVGPTKELEHIESQAHKNILNETERVPQPSTQNTTSYHCEACEVDVLNTPESIQKHEDALGHKISEAFYRVTMSYKEPHHHYERTGNSIDMLFCRVCNANILVEMSKKHLELSQHANNYQSLLNENKIQKSGDKFVCQICSEEMSENEILKHVSSSTHLFERQVILSSNSQASSLSKGTGYHCAVCRVDVPNNPKCILIHEQGNSHMTKLKNLSLDDESKVLMTKTANGRQAVCSLCKVAVALNGVTQHIRGAKHRANKVAATTKST